MESIDITTLRYAALALIAVGITDLVVLHVPPLGPRLRGPVRMAVWFMAVSMLVVGLALGAYTLL